MLFRNFCKFLDQLCLVAAKIYPLVSKTKKLEGNPQTALKTHRLAAPNLAHSRTF